MLKCVEQLVESTSNHKRIGNHCKKENNQKIAYFYHETPIITIWKDDQTLEIRNGGWNTRSTNYAIKCYLELLGKTASQIIDLR